MTKYKFDQQPHESEKLYNRFKRYRAKHKSITLEKFAEEEGVTKSTIAQNSAKWNWDARADAWDAYEAQKLYKKVQDDFEKLNKKGLHDMDSFIDELNELRKDAMKRFRKEAINSTTCLNIMKNYITCYREATEIYYINCRKPLFPPDIVEEDTSADDKIDNILSENEAHNHVVQLRKEGSAKIMRPGSNISD